jgi:hypothetical protein
VTVAAVPKPPQPPPLVKAPSLLELNADVLSAMAFVRPDRPRVDSSSSKAAASSATGENDAAEPFGVGAGHSLLGAAIALDAPAPHSAPVVRPPSAQSSLGSPPLPPLSPLPFSRNMVAIRALPSSPGLPPRSPALSHQPGVGPAAAEDQAVAALMGLSHSLAVHRAGDSPPGSDVDEPPPEQDWLQAARQTQAQDRLREFLLARQHDSPSVASAASDADRASQVPGRVRQLAYPSGAFSLPSRLRQSTPTRVVPTAPRQAIEMLRRLSGASRTASGSHEA